MTTRFASIIIDEHFVTVEASYRKRNPSIDADPHGEILCERCGKWLTCDYDIMQHNYLGRERCWSIFGCAACSFAIVYIYTLIGEPENA